MLSDAPAQTSVDSDALPPRAAIALLTLQLRSALQVATEAEAEEAGWDLGVALAQLRARLEPLVDDRRRAHAEAVLQAEADAASAIASAHAEATLIVAQSSPHPDLASLDDQPQPVFEPEHDYDDQPWTRPDSEFAAQAAPEVVVADAVWSLTPPPAPAPSPPPITTLPALPHPGFSDDPRQPVTVVLDADSFARAFAAAITPVLEARAEMLAANRTVTMMPAPTKKSFWADTWHADVLLSVLAMVIVVVVLIAWST
jgi:hypothetical protein